MIIIWAIFISYVSFAVKSFSKAVLAAFPFSLLFTTVPLVNLGSVEISFNLALFSVLGLLFLVKRKRCEIKNPYLTPIIVISIGFILVAILGTYHSSLYVTFLSCFDYLILLLIWPYLKSKNDIHYIINCFVSVFFVITIYSIIEFVLQNNIWMEYLTDCFPKKSGMTIYENHLDDIRFGYGRCSSFFHFPIPFGDACAIFFSFLLFWNTYSKGMIKKHNVLIMLFLLLIGILLSNSRAPVVMLAIGSLVVFDFKFILRNKFIIIFVLVFLFLGAYNYFNEVLLSIFDSSSENVGGSSMDMRNAQLYYCYQEFLSNPWFGGGFNRMMELQDPENRELMGGESHLFVLMVNQGICGIITYVYTSWYSIKVFPKGKRKFPAIIILGWVIGAVVSLTTGLFLSYPMLLLLITLRAYQLKILSE